MLINYELLNQFWYTLYQVGLLSLFFSTVSSLYMAIKLYQNHDKIKDELDKMDIKEEGRYIGLILTQGMFFICISYAIITVILYAEKLKEGIAGFNMLWVGGAIFGAISFLNLEIVFYKQYSNIMDDKDKKH